MESKNNIIEPKGIYNGARYLSLNVSATNTLESEYNDFLSEQNENYRGGIIVFPKQQNFVLTKKDFEEFRLSSLKIGRFLCGTYNANNGVFFSNDSPTVEICGIDDETLFSIATIVMKNMNVNLVFVKSYDSGRIVQIKL